MENWDFNLYLSENQANRNEMWFAVDIHNYNNYVPHMCLRILKKNKQTNKTKQKKNTLIKQFLANFKFFTKMPQKFYIFITIVLFEVYLKLFRPTASLSIFSVG